MNKKNSIWAFAAFAISLILFFWSLWHRPIHIDDVWLAEYSYWLERLGYVKSEALRGFFGAENRLYVYHKLLAFEGAAAIRLFGFHAYVLKSLSLAYVLGSLVALYYVYQKHGQQKATQSLLLFAIFLSFFHTMNLGFIFRPEIRLLCWGLCSFILLDKFLSEPSAQKYLILAALLSGVGTATHLNGVVFTGASVAFLWIQRRWWAGFVFGAIASWGLFFYFLIDVRSVAELQLSFHQLVHWRDVATGKYGWEMFTRVITEQGRYLHSPPEIIYSFLLLFLLIPARKYLWANKRRLTVYTLVLSFFVAQVTHGTNTNYLMYAFPFFILLAIYSFSWLVEKDHKKYATSIVAIFLVASWIYNIQYFRKRESLKEEISKVVEFIPADVQVLAPGQLMFQGLGKFHIQSFVSYRDRVEAGNLDSTGTALFSEANKFQIEYIVFDESNFEFFHLKDGAPNSYERLETQPSTLFQIFKAKKSVN